MSTSVPAPVSSSKSRDLCDEFIVDRLFPKDELHLICGPSGAGKTTLLYQMAYDFHRGLPLLGDSQYKTYPKEERICLVSCDRSIFAMERLMYRLMDPCPFPTFSILGKTDHERTFSGLMDRLAKSHKFKTNKDFPTIIFLDGIGSLCRRMTDDGAVTDFLNEVNYGCAIRGITMVATIRSVKSRSGDTYLSPRERIMGSGALSSISDTKISIEPQWPREPANTSRVLTAMPQDYPTRILYFALTEHGLIPESDESRLNTKLDNWLTGHAASSVISTAQAIVAGAELELSESTSKRWLTDQCDLGTIERLTRGTYRVL